MRTLGAAERALELLCRRSLQRVAFGKPLADLGANADVIANARIMLEQARLLTLKAAWMLDEVGTKGARSEISQTKLRFPTLRWRLSTRQFKCTEAPVFPPMFLWPKCLPRSARCALRTGPTKSIAP